jgi:hypothetical protein
MEGSSGRGAARSASTAPTAVLPPRGTWISGGFALSQIEGHPPPGVHRPRARRCLRSVAVRDVARLERRRASPTPRDQPISWSASRRSPPPRRRIGELPTRPPVDPHRGLRPLDHGGLAPAVPSSARRQSGGGVSAISNCTASGRLASIQELAAVGDRALFARCQTDAEQDLAIGRLSVGDLRDRHGHRSGGQHGQGRLSRQRHRHDAGRRGCQRPGFVAGRLTSGRKSRR